MVVARQVEQDAMQPGIETGTAPKPVRRANGLKEGLLHEVLRFGFIPTKQASGPEQAVPRGDHQFLHGPGVLAAETLDQLILVHAPFVPPSGKGFKESIFLETPRLGARRNGIRCIRLPARTDYPGIDWRPLPSLSRRNGPGSFISRAACFPMSGKIIWGGFMKREFTAVIKQDEGWWIGWVEEIPGANSQGKTKAELLKNLRSAIKEALELNRAEARAAAQSDYEEALIHA
jgi:predicted RNase H-like HicB family nuclease